MKMKLNLFLACVCALTLAVACDNDGDPDAGTDAGTGMDAGEDAGDTMTDGGFDAGEDGGPPPAFSVRLVHNIPGMTGSTAIPGGTHICSWVSIADGTVIDGTATFLTETLGAIPFRGVSPYLQFPVADPAAYIVGLYEPDSITACPADPYDAAATPAVLLAPVAATDVPTDSFSSLIATGLIPGTLTATGSDLPAFCNSGVPPTFDQPCTDTTQLLIINDDQTAPAAGESRIRVSNMVVNSAPVGFTVCYDPGLVADPSSPGSCVADFTPTDHVAVATAGYGTATDYVERAPIAPTTVTIPDGAGGTMDVPGGALYLEFGPTCAAPEPGESCYPILPDALRPVTDPPLPDEVRFQLEPDAVTTIFVSGYLPPGAPFQAAFGASFMIWQDNYVAPAP